MNVIQELVVNFQELAAQVPELVRPLVVALAAAIPFLEGEMGAMVGIVGGLHPVVAGVAAAAGNFLSVLVVVLVTSRAGSAVTGRRARAAARVGAGPMGYGDDALVMRSAPAQPVSAGRQRFNTWLVRFGVPGASILGPLAIPTQVTSAILVGGGTSRRWVLLWQAVAIALWTTVTTVSVWAALTYVVQV